MRKMLSLTLVLLAAAVFVPSLPAASTPETAAAIAAGPALAAGAVGAPMPLASLSGGWRDHDEVVVVWAGAATTVFLILVLIVIL